MLITQDSNLLMNLKLYYFLLGIIEVLSSNAYLKDN